VLAGKVPRNSNVSARRRKFKISNPLQKQKSVS